VSIKLKCQVTQDAQDLSQLVSTGYELDVKTPSTRLGCLHNDFVLVETFRIR
jgi:hypothetical protein